MFGIFPNIAVHGANALGCPLTAGYPTMTAFHGLTCDMLRRLEQEVETEVRPRGVAIIHHAGQLRVCGKYRNYLTQKRCVSDDYPRPSADRKIYYFSPPSKPMPELDLTFSLVVEIETKFPIQPMIEKLHRDAVHFVIGPKALGGTVQSHRGLKVSSGLQDSLRLLPAGYLITDRSDELLHPEMDALDRMIDLLRERHDPHRFFAPMQIGWRCLAPLVKRETPRGNAAHTFVEPLIGMVEFIRTSRATPAVLAAALWRARIDYDNNLFLLETANDGSQEFQGADSCGIQDTKGTNCPASAPECA